MPFMNKKGFGKLGGKDNRGGTDGATKGRSGTLARLSMASDLQHDIPTQGQSSQFDAIAPASVGRQSALRRMAKKGR